ncbi:SDR family oxidoreductase [Gloeocapsa sp. PCC 73106]|uniref:SDR family oxidoreductase n=1 Tax=Gloeocapsa sp. PCC 73106 TaxID=102232 RepID=UPI0002AC9003|nr:SDR family oxidoreductase [Gloeocapsa sp. PCC 73106]ELR97467.1 short-chain dehydrogenase of unknown substrate specificity [Gloeocapsa sp. PCC 73106]
MNFKHQNAIITGGSSGIGKETARLLVLAGSNLCLIARDLTKLAKIQSELMTQRVFPEQKILIYSADVSNQQQIKSVIARAIANLGVPDLLITSAGITHPDYFSNLSSEIFEQMMAVNYFGSLYCVQTVLPYMLKKGTGHIVFISSAAGLIGIYGYTAYSASKFAIRGLAESLRLELKPAGITLSVVYPPDTDTPQLETENKTKPPETKAIAGAVKIWSPEAIAQEILKGIKQKTFMITPGLEISFLSKFHSLLATPLNWYFEAKIKQIQRQNPLN